MTKGQTRKGERGASLLEFAIAATVFLTVLFAIVEFGRALWVHNALSDAARRGARYAVLHKASDIDDVKKVVVYGDTTSTTPILENLSTTNVDVTYNGFNLDEGTVSVSVHDYSFQLVLPLLVSSISMPNYTTTLTGESAGLIPDVE
ncbi:MAG TPA: TadE family protein [Pyrinomonadaceae bacterium]|jgi:Flp pilus assembly protein TadG|nr:TadE family protein [Pyrinomonadaceae bacterium]